MAFPATEAELATFVQQMIDTQPGQGVIAAGVGSPEGVVTADVGVIYQRRDGGAGTSLYVKESGAGTSTGWVGK